MKNIIITDITGEKTMYKSAGYVYSGNYLIVTSDAVHDVWNLADVDTVEFLDQ